MFLNHVIGVSWYWVYINIVLINTDYHEWVVEYITTVLVVFMLWNDEETQK